MLHHVPIVNNMLFLELSGEPGGKLGERFGNISGAGIAVRCTHFSNLIDKDKNLKARVTTLKGRIINI